MANRYAEQALRAIEAGREAIRDETLSLEDIGKKHNVTRRAVGEARILLKFGTAEELSNIQSGEIGLQRTADAIIKRLTPEQHKEMRARANIMSAKRLQRVEDDVKTWKSVSTAIKAIADLPAPADVVASIKRSHGRTNTINDQIFNASKWMEDFVSEWTRPSTTSGDPDA